MKEQTRCRLDESIQQNASHTDCRQGHWARLWRQQDGQTGGTIVFAKPQRHREIWEELGLLGNHAPALLRLRALVKGADLKTRRAVMLEHRSAWPSHARSVCLAHGTRVCVIPAWIRPAPSLFSSQPPGQSQRVASTAPRVTIQSPAFPHPPEACFSTRSQRLCRGSRHSPKASPWPRLTVPGPLDKKSDKWAGGEHSHEHYESRTAAAFWQKGFVWNV